MDRRPGNWNIFLKVLRMLNIFRTQIPFLVTYKNIFQSTLFNFSHFMNKFEAVGHSRLNGEASLHLSADSPKGIFGKRQKQLMNLKIRLSEILKAMVLLFKKPVASSLFLDAYKKINEPNKYHH